MQPTGARMLQQIDVSRVRMERHRARRTSIFASEFEAFMDAHMLAEVVMSAEPLPTASDGTCVRCRIHSKSVRCRCRGRETRGKRREKGKRNETKH